MKKKDLLELGKQLYIEELREKIDLTNIDMTSDESGFVTGYFPREFIEAIKNGS